MYLLCTLRVLQMLEKQGNYVQEDMHEVHIIKKGMKASGNDMQ